MQGLCPPFFNRTLALLDVHKDVLPMLLAELLEVLVADTHEGLEADIEAWQSRPNVSNAGWVRDESDAFGEGLLRT